MVRNDIKNSSLLKTKFLIYAFNGRTLFKAVSIMAQLPLVHPRGARYGRKTSVWLA